MKNPLLAFAACLRHAFMTGAGYEKDFEQIEIADLYRWTHYDPPNVGSFKTMTDILAAAGCEEAIREVLPVQRTTTGVVIVAAAVKVGELVTSIARPGRHHDILNTFRINDGCDHLVVQGFLTSAGTFVDRETALELAIKAGQYNAPAEGKRELFSEDLW